MAFLNPASSPWYPEEDQESQTSNNYAASSSLDSGYDSSSSPAYGAAMPSIFSIPQTIFDQRGMLKQSVAKQEKLYVCQKSLTRQFGPCGRQFRDKTALLRHLKNCHNEYLPLGVEDARQHPSIRDQSISDGRSGSVGRDFTDLADLRHQTGSTRKTGSVMHAFRKEPQIESHLHRAPASSEQSTRATNTRRPDSDLASEKRPTDTKTDVVSGNESFDLSSLTNALGGPSRPSLYDVSSAGTGCGGFGAVPQMTTEDTTDAKPKHSAIVKDVSFSNAHESLGTNPKHDTCEQKIQISISTDVQDDALDRQFLASPQRKTDSPGGSSIVTGFLDDDLGSLAGLSAYSDDLNAADQRAWATMSKAAIIDKFLDDVMDYTEHEIRDILLRYSQCDGEITGDGGKTSSDSGIIQSASSADECQQIPTATSGLGEHSGQGERRKKGDDDGEDERFPSGRRPLPNDKVTDPMPPIACPYLKGNPEMAMNNSCKTGFPDMSRLKEHLYRCHRRPVFCFRCKARFGAHAELEKHQTSEDQCALRKDINAPNGISSEQERSIARIGYKRRDPDTANKWKAVYKIIFPNALDATIPSPWYQTTWEQDKALDEYSADLVSVLPDELADDLISSLLQRHDIAMDAEIQEKIRITTRNAIKRVHQTYKETMSSQRSSAARVSKLKRRASNQGRRPDPNRSQSTQLLKVPLTPVSSRKQNATYDPQIPSPVRAVPNQPSYSASATVRKKARKISSAPSMSYSSRSDGSNDGIRTPLLPDQGSMADVQPLGDNIAFMGGALHGVDGSYAPNTSQVMDSGPAGQMQDDVCMVKPPAYASGAHHMSNTYAPQPIPAFGGMSHEYFDPSQELMADMFPQQGIHMTPEVAQVFQPNPYINPSILAQPRVSPWSSQNPRGAQPPVWPQQGPSTYMGNWPQ